jgi:type IV secretory pathway TraG/TraD family ATPase VirD4
VLRSLKTLLRGVGARMDASDEIFLGMREVWGQKKPVSLSCADRRHHVYVIGKSGTGKTTLLRNMILQDIEAGRGVGVIDPHGDLASELLDYIPRHRTDDVVYFDPADGERSVAFNLLANVPKEKRHLVASGVVGSFKSIFPEFFGPRMEYIFNAAIAALLECVDVSLLALQRMLTDARYRAWIVNQVDDPVVRNFWESEFEGHDKRTKSEMVSPILNKVGPIFMSPHLRSVLGQVPNRLDMREMMDRGQIFIANLSKGRLGPDKANLLGSFLVSQFELAALSRVDAAEHERRDFFLFVDEFQSLISDSFATMLSEARKYRLCLTLSHQYSSQLKPNIADAVFGNCGSLVAFRVGYEDAEKLEKAFGKSYPASSFACVGNYEAHMKLLQDGRDTEAFYAETFPPFGTQHKHRENIIHQSRLRYSRCRSSVEEKIRRWFEASRYRMY